MNPTKRKGTMSSFPHISHHLFVSAVRKNPTRKTAEPESVRDGISTAQEVPLEVLHYTKALPSTAIHPLRVSAVAGQGSSRERMNSVISITELVQQRYRRSYASLGRHPGYGGRRLPPPVDLAEKFMEARSLQFVSAACAGELIGAAADVMVQRVCTDSRHVAAGDLFVALPGDRFDGHDFLEQASGKGALAVMVERNRKRPQTLQCPVIAVENCRKALGLLAARYRKDFELPVVAVGGSNGKTTTKEMLAAVLRQKWVTLASEASF